jgi:hypothetical protein
MDEYPKSGGLATQTAELLVLLLVIAFAFIAVCLTNGPALRGE